ncbi:MAG: hypothetical protein Q9181_008299 [Wetmoreana brouardii]
MTCNILLLVLPVLWPFISLTLGAPASDRTPGEMNKGPNDPQSSARTTTAYTVSAPTTTDAVVGPTTTMLGLRLANVTGVLRDPSLATPTATATIDPQSLGHALATKLDRSQQALQISQYARKDPNDGGDAGKYWILAGVTAPNEQFPGGADKGSTGAPQVASSDFVSFDIKNSLDGQMHKVEIHTPPLNSTGDLDQAPLTITGFPGKDDKFDTSNPGKSALCDVGPWQTTKNPSDQARLPIGGMRRDIRCLGDAPKAG